MQPDLSPKSKTLLGVTELTLVATIKDGVIPALDTRSYTTRAALVMKTLNTLRLSSREAEPTPLIQDAVDRIRTIHSFRLSILGLQRKQLMLSVTFDGGWEPYMRQIWRDLGPLLDLIFCNCEDYLTSHDHSYADYIAWVRKVQVNTDFFYTAGAQTVNDRIFLRKREQVRIDGQQRAAPLDTNEAWARQAIPAITGLYRLSDMFPRNIPDEIGLLERATQRLLGPEVLEKAYSLNGRTPTEREALKWYLDISTKLEDDSLPTASYSLQKIQGGILESYADITHGCLLMVELDDAGAAEKLLKYVKTNQLVSAADQSRARSDPYLNLALTYPGLLLAGLPDGLVQRLPQEFREGMAARAGALGDWRYNHPLHWRLPQRIGTSTSGWSDRVELSSIHAVLQVQLSDKQEIRWCGDPLGQGDHPLKRYLTDLIKTFESQGARVVSIQPMQRLTSTSAPVRGHFDYVDGISQPTLGGPGSTTYKESVEVGDLFLGFRNSMKDPALTGPLWSHSTFLVIRKLRQDVKAFREAVDSAVHFAPSESVSPNSVNSAGVVPQSKRLSTKTLLMGRDPDGCSPLTAPTVTNDFNYSTDKSGSICPFQSHVRRANPRTFDPPRDDLQFVPRILRRGMSYGPAVDKKNADEERGLLFMAYNASIAEQFEVVQSWLAGGNSASRDSWSGLRDPFLGVLLDDEPLDFKFTSTDGTETRVSRQPDRPWVRLEWGMYLFVPSLPAIDELRLHAARAAAIDRARAPEVARTQPKDAEAVKDRQGLEDQQNTQVSALAARGAVMIKALQAKEQSDGFAAAKAQWKLALEDLGARMSGTTQALWTAIRELQGGVLRTPYGILVGKKEQVMQVFTDSAKNLTANGYLERMKNSFGPIYLGLDKQGSDYSDQSGETNKAIQSISRKMAFNSAYKHTYTAVDGFVRGLSGDDGINIEVKDLVDRVLADLSKEYFGLPESVYVIDGGWQGVPAVKSQPPRCPGHFHAPSRYIFQPQPDPQVATVAEANGMVLREAVKEFVCFERNFLTQLPAIPKAILQQFPDDDEAARTLIGALMGFLPTVDGNLRAVLYEWMNDRSLWDYQSQLISQLGMASKEPPLLETVQSILRDSLAATMQLRPVPELTWRRAVKKHNINNVEVLPGDTVVVGIVSAVHEDLLREERLPADGPAGFAGDRDLTPIFGGARDGSASAPTHACPGYEMAMGVLLGTLAGLMLSARLRPTLSPVTLRMTPRPAAAAA